MRNSNQTKEKQRKKNFGNGLFVKNLSSDTKKVFPKNSRSFCAVIFLLYHLFVQQSNKLTYLTKCNNF